MHTQLHTEIKNGRYVYDRFGHPPTDEHSWQNAAGRCWVGGDRGRDPHHSGYSRVCGGSHRAHPDLCSTRGDMPHCSPFWVYIRGTEARVTRETGALVRGTFLSCVLASCSVFTGAPDLFPAQNGTVSTQRAHYTCSLLRAPSLALPPSIVGEQSETAFSSCT
jgi:hypothetical protein